MYLTVTPSSTKYIRIALYKNKEYPCFSTIVQPYFVHREVLSSKVRITYTTHPQTPNRKELFPTNPEIYKGG